MGRPIIDLAGKTFGYLYVIERTHDAFSASGNAVVQYLCVCNYNGCANRKVVKGVFLRNGFAISCGCYRDNMLKTQTKNITDNLFGKLLVIEKDYLDENYGWFWKCQCECGAICTKRGSYLRNGHTTSCGKCVSSKGELKIQTLLDENNITYEREKRFDDCKNKQKLPFDFYLPDYNLIIEFHGQQHYDEMGYWGGSDKLKRTKKNDKIKKTYCLNSNINYLEIPYYQIDNLESILFERLG